MDEATMKRIAGTVVEVLGETLQAQLTAATCAAEMLAVMEGCRDTLVSQFAFPPRAAANLTRMLCQGIALRVGRGAIYTAAEVEIIRGLVAADIGV